MQETRRSIIECDQANHMTKMLTWQDYCAAINIDNRDKARIKRAFDYGKKMHEGQVRKNSGLPYFIHPIRVSINLKHEDDDLVIAGLLHDVIEDTDQTEKDIENRFGHRVAQLVKGVSKSDEITMFEALESVLPEFPDAIKLRLADRLDNLRNKFESMPEKTKNRYREETPKMIEYANEYGISEFIEDLQHLNKNK